MSNVALKDRFYAHYKGGLYYVNNISYDVDRKCDVVTYTHVSGKSYVRTRKEFEEYVNKYDSVTGELNPDWGDRPGSFCCRFLLIDEWAKIADIRWD